jgi:hypothetical protein
MNQEDVYGDGIADVCEGEFTYHPEAEYLYYHDILKQRNSHTLYPLLPNPFGL